MAIRDDRSFRNQLPNFLSQERNCLTPPPDAWLLVLDAPPGLSGSTYARALKARGINIPIIFITGHGDIPTVQAMKAGVVEFHQAVS